VRAYQKNGRNEAAKAVVQLKGTTTWWQEHQNLVHDQEYMLPIGFVEHQQPDSRLSQASKAVGLRQDEGNAGLECTSGGLCSRG
jgi:hypothetical protein